MGNGLFDPFPYSGKLPSIKDRLLLCVVLCLPGLALPCLALPCLALPCLALPCLALPCLALPCLALPCLVLCCVCVALRVCVLCSAIPQVPSCQGNRDRLQPDGPLGPNANFTCISFLSAPSYCLSPDDIFLSEFGHRDRWQTCK